jgi:acetyltransferase-like isoleucine patch superfamily enzyme
MDDAVRPSPAPPRALVWWMRAVNAADRLRLRALPRLHPGVEIDPSASPQLALARFRVAPGARLRVGANVVTERRPGAITFLLEPEAEVTIGEGVWLRTELGPIVLVAFAGARLEIGPQAFLNGCHLSAKTSVRLGRRAFVGPGTRVFDSDQHDFDAERPEQSEAVEIGDHSWVASDVTVLRGVRIGAHCVIGARSVVTRSIPDHTLAFGAPATPRGVVGERSGCR